MGRPVPIPWPLSSAPGANSQESAGRLFNCYAEPLQDESGPAKVVWRKSPGLSKFATSGFTGYRGGIYSGGSALVALKNELITFGSGGVVTTVGALAGTLPAIFAHNNLTPTPQIACVTENGAQLVTTGSIAGWPDPNLPFANSVAFQDGYFHFTIGDRRVFASGINATSVNALCFTTIQSRPANTLYRAIPYGGLMFFFTDVHCEVFQNAGSAIQAPAYPYSRLNVIDRGLLGPYAISGYQEGFGKLAWVADDFGVYRMINGLTPEKISPPDLDRLIKSVTDVTTLRAGCYVFAGHSFWTISGPGWTWEFNFNTQKWDEKLTVGPTGLISQLWPADGDSFHAFGKWMFGSNVTGNIITPDDTVYKDEGNPQIWRMESGPVKNFPARVGVGRADFDFVVGVGNPSGAANEQNPQVMISWSDDGGRRWSTPVIRSLGASYEPFKRVSIVGVGTTQLQGRRWRLEVSDGIYIGFLGATMNADPRAA